MPIVAQLSLNTSQRELATIVATPYPAAPDFTLFRGQNKASLCFSAFHLSYTTHSAAVLEPSNYSHF